MMKNTFHIAYFCLFGLTLGCQKMDSQNQSPKFIESSDSVKVVQFQNNKAVVFRSDFLIVDSTDNGTAQTSSFAEVHIPDSNTVFDPSLKNIVEFDGTLATHLERLKDTAKEIRSGDTTFSNHILWKSQATPVNSKNLLKQYWGYVNQENDSLMMGTFIQVDTEKKTQFDEMIFRMWKKEPIIIHDGGPSYYSAKYNLSKDSLIYLRVNAN